MPFYREIPLEGQGHLSLWKISGEPPTVELTAASLKRLAGMKREDHRQGFRAVRKLLERAGLSDHDLFYEPNGRPFLKDGRHISISHSHAFAALYIGREPYGIDIEKIQPRIVRNRAHFIADEVIPIEFEPEALTIIWAVKEAIFKISDSRNMNFKTDLHVRPFTVGEVGEGSAYSTFPDWEVEFKFWYERIDAYVLVGAGRLYNMVGII